MTPKEVVQKWVDVFNKADAEALAEFYADDAINYQVAEKPIEGKTAIAEMFRKEFAQAEMTCVIENIFEDGQWAIIEWKGSGADGLRGCGFFNVVNDKIIYQRGYWDKLTFLRLNDLPIPTE